MVKIQNGQIEKALVELAELKEKHANIKAVLKQYRITSDRLKELKKVKRELQEQIEEEKKRIEDEFLEHEDYEEAMNEELELKPKMRDKQREIREAVSSLNPEQQLSTYEYNVKGEPLKIQVERVAKVYINGKEER